MFFQHWCLHQRQIQGLASTCTHTLAPLGRWWLRNANLFPEREILKNNPWCSLNYLGLTFVVTINQNLKKMFIYRSLVTRVCLLLTTFGICENTISLCKMMVVSKFAFVDTCDGKQLKSTGQITASEVAWIKRLLYIVGLWRIFGPCKDRFWVGAGLNYTSL